LFPTKMLWAKDGIPDTSTPTFRSLTERDAWSIIIILIRHQRMSMSSYPTMANGSLEYGMAMVYWCCKMVTDTLVPWNAAFDTAVMACTCGPMVASTKETFIKTNVKEGDTFRGRMEPPIKAIFGNHNGMDDKACMSFPTEIPTTDHGTMETMKDTGKSLAELSGVQSSPMELSGVELS
jgi:hypothetical protein